MSQTHEPGLHPDEGGRSLRQSAPNQLWQTDFTLNCQANFPKCSDDIHAWTAKANKRVQFGYGLNYLIDIEYAVIVDVEATPARTYDEVAATKTMIKRTDERLGLKPERLAADTAYGTGKFLHWVIASGITTH